MSKFNMEKYLSENKITIGNKKSINESYVSWDTSLSSLIKDTNNLRSYVNDIQDAKTKRNNLKKVKTILKHLEIVETLFSEIDKDIDDDELGSGKFK